ncbi:N-acetylneuraminate lyase [Petaurus breviceps papuanus]|uniref:N-acetylneuraminate lyase n=1 Tax=Petaurus breviceps papuanus TaxID=3040969 RepID=UPI0036DA4721
MSKELGSNPDHFGPQASFAGPLRCTWPALSWGGEIERAKEKLKEEDSQGKGDEMKIRDLLKGKGQQEKGLGRFDLKVGQEEEEEDLEKKEEEESGLTRERKLDPPVEARSSEAAMWQQLRSRFLPPGQRPDCTPKLPGLKVHTALTSHFVLGIYGLIILETATAAGDLKSLQPEAGQATLRLKPQAMEGLSLAPRTLCCPLLAGLPGCLQQEVQCLFARNHDDWMDHVIVHVGALSLKDSQDLAQHAAEIGADGIAVIAPFFFKPVNKDALIAFLKEVAAAAPEVPFYYYHIPALTGVKIRAEELLNGIQDQIPTFQGLKFSDVDLLDFGQCVDQNSQRQFALLFGVDEQLLSALAMGATGAVGSTYNYLGKKTNQMLEAFERQDLSLALNYQLCIQKFMNYVIKLGLGVAQTKAIITFVSGIQMGPPRLPLQKASEEFTLNAEAKLKSLESHCFH